ncbi:MAG: peptide chain release factor 1 [Alphaproteobacteria bacterium]|nr:peptide chain release factor 1 [Alphaproteobacteria bacterium]
MAVVPEDKLEAVVARFRTIETQLTTAAGGGPEYVKLTKEYSSLGPVVAAIEALRKARNDVAGAEEVMKDPSLDAEMKALAEAELYDGRARRDELERKVTVALLPKDEADERNAILEVRAGTGGDEAGLFGGDLFRMYQRYAELRGWRFEALAYDEKDGGGIKEAQAMISGFGVFARLKFESGVHRVQRVPETEAQGRIHTSTATVAVLPEAQEVDVKVEDKDLRIDVYRSSGPGGQSVNTTDSAVRITHLPTGIVVAMQDEKSQHKNRAKAMKILLSRIYDAKRAEQDAARAAQRRGQVGTGDRSERIRTYNFPQGRVTDHRINLTVHQIDKVMAGEGLDPIIEALITTDEAERLVAMDEKS